MLSTLNLAGNVRRLREARGWSSRQLAERVQAAGGRVAESRGPAHTYLWRIEQGYYDNPGISIVLGLAVAFGVTIEDLLRDNDDDG